MSLHYLLDGYNIINQVPLWAKGGLQDGRQALLNWITMSHPHGSSRNAVTVVFDGSTEHFGRSIANMSGPDCSGNRGGGTGSAGARVVFTQGESADDYIKRVVETAAQKKKYVVVSDDKGIKLYVRALGAAVLSVREFASGLFKGPARSSRTAGRTSSGEKSKYVSLAQAQKINQELEKIWLKDPL